MKQYHSVEEADKELSNRDGSCSVLVEEVQDYCLVQHVLPPVNFAPWIERALTFPVKFYNTAR